MSFRNETETVDYIVFFYPNPIESEGNEYELIIRKPQWLKLAVYNEIDYIVYSIYTDLEITVSSRRYKSLRFLRCTTGLGIVTFWSFWLRINVSFGSSYATPQLIAWLKYINWGFPMNPQVAQNAT